MNKQLFTQEQIDYVTSQVEQYQRSICPQLTAKLFLETIRQWTEEQQQLTLAFLHDVSVETLRFYYECMIIQPSYKNPVNFVSFKIGD